MYYSAQMLLAFTTSMAVFATIFKQFLQCTGRRNGGVRNGKTDRYRSAGEIVLMRACDECMFD